MAKATITVTDSDEGSDEIHVSCDFGDGFDADSPAHAFAFIAAMHAKTALSAPSGQDPHEEER